MSGIATIVVGLAAAVVVLILCEGLSSCAVALRDRPTVLWATGRKRSKHDRDLGWVNRPNTYIPDMYGTDRYLKINNQGFRNNQDFTPDIAEGRIRIICAGDSFTFAEGVSNDHTWCELLRELDPTLETVNMGQTGYGIDQAYLWYKRDGLRLSHQVCLLAFITDDFYRMQTATFAGYAKPVLDVVAGKLVVKNTPVPRRSYYRTWLIRQAKNFEGLRTLDFLTRLFRKMRGGAAKETEVREAKNRRTREVLRKILEELSALREERSVFPALVYLPTIHEVVQRNRFFDAEQWIKFLEGETIRLGIPLFNVLRDFRPLSAQEIFNMYIPESEPAAPNHLNELGNAFVARAIYEKLKTYLPKVMVSTRAAERPL